MIKFQHVVPDGSGTYVVDSTVIEAWTRLGYIVESTGTGITVEFPGGGGWPKERLTFARIPVVAPARTEYPQTYYGIDDGAYV